MVVSLGIRTPLQAMKNWNKLTYDLFNKQPYDLTGGGVHLMTILAS